MEKRVTGNERDRLFALVRFLRLLRVTVRLRDPADRPIDRSVDRPTMEEVAVN